MCCASFLVFFDWDFFLKMSWFFLFFCFFDFLENFLARLVGTRPWGWTARGPAQDGWHVSRKGMRTLAQCF